MDMWINGYSLLSIQRLYETSKWSSRRVGMGMLISFDNESERGV